MTLKTVSGGDRPGDQCRRGRGSGWLLMNTARRSPGPKLEFGGQLRADETVRWGMQSLHQSGPLLWTVPAARAYGHQGPVSVMVTLPRAKMAGNKGGLPCGTTRYFSVVRQTSWHQGCWQYNSSKIGISIRMTLERAAMRGRLQHCVGGGAACS